MAPAKVGYATPLTFSPPGQPAVSYYDFTNGTPSSPPACRSPNREAEPPRPPPVGRTVPQGLSLVERPGEPHRRIGNVEIWKSGPSHVLRKLEPDCRRLRGSRTTQPFSPSGLLNRKERRAEENGR